MLKYATTASPPTAHSGLSFTHCENGSHCGLAIFAAIGVTIDGKRCTVVEGVIGAVSPTPVTFGMYGAITRGKGDGNGMFDWLRE